MTLDNLIRALLRQTGAVRLNDFFYSYGKPVLTVENSFGHTWHVSLKRWPRVANRINDAWHPGDSAVRNSREPARGRENLTEVTTMTRNDQMIRQTRRAWRVACALHDGIRRESLANPADHFAEIAERLARRWANETCENFYHATTEVTP